DRIEEGAARLIAFAEQLSDEDWHTRVPEGGQPGRTVGVIVHHVASVYPIEVNLAQTIASGTPVVDVTWNAVNQLNAGQAIEHASVQKQETLALLRKNSAKA